MDFDKLCENRTPLKVRCVPLDDRHGRDVLVVIAKVTYAVTPNGAGLLAAEQSPVRMGDERTDGGPWSSVRFPSDFVDEKPGTDVLLVGSAYPPADRTVTEMTVSLRLERGHATMQKTLRVYGPRVYQKGVLGLAPGASARLGVTPLVYELAYGGNDEGPAGFVIERRNPSGRGVAGDASRLVGQPAHVIEDPRAVVASRTPAGFGPIPWSWSPRADRQGTRDTAWARERAPVRPIDFDPRANCAAQPDQWTSEPLIGDERVEILGATPSGVWRFQLPRYAPRFTVVVRGLARELPTHLDTYFIDAEARQVELVWRASFPAPRPLELIDTVFITDETPLPEPLLEDLRHRNPVPRQA
jgi:hypothetical protein